MAFYYEKAKPSSFESEMTSHIVVQCARKLGIQPPKVMFVKNSKAEAGYLLRHDIDGAGFAAPALRTIYIGLPTTLFNMVKTIAHECWHIFEGDNGLSADENKADLFADKARAEIIG